VGMSEVDTSILKQQQKRYDSLQNQKIEAIVAQEWDKARALVPQIAIAEEEVLRLESKMCEEKGDAYKQEATSITIHCFLTFSLHCCGIYIVRFRGTKRYSTCGPL